MTARPSILAAILLPLAPVLAAASGPASPAPALAVAPAPADAPTPQSPDPAFATAAPASTAATEPASEEAADDRLVLGSLKLKISGVIFALWARELALANQPDHTAGANRFDVTRAYVNIEPRITETISLRITPDVTRVSAAGTSLDGNLALRLKYGYVQFDDVLLGARVRGGMQPTPIVDFTDSVWGYRVLGPSPFEIFGGSPSSDLGAGVGGKQLGGALEYALLASNGEGYTKAEQSARDAARYKDVAGRVTLAPFAEASGALRKLRLTAMAQYGIVRATPDGNHVDRARLYGLASWEGGLGTLGAGGGPTWDHDAREEGGVRLRNGLLLTAFGWVNLPLNLRLVGRYDWFDPNLDEEAQALTHPAGRTTRLIAGLAYRFTDEVQVIADYQRFGYEHPSGTKATDPGTTAYLHLEAKY
ncbi:MAG TPA: hypothetical protein VN033_02085 [Vulgatibacter sp.]|nr:hypothetical protein [Vulgatibacter sp.]